MVIIIDSREQKPLFQKEWYTTINRKLDEGDYNIPELENYIVVERKTCNDFYGSIIKGHTRFKDEIIRSRLQGKIFYIFVEGSKELFLSMKWSKKYLKCRGNILAKIISTLEERYNIIMVWCHGPKDMEDKILQCFKINRLLYEYEENNL